MQKKNIAAISVILGLVILFASCIKRAPRATCLPTTAGIEKMTVQFVCPEIGASYSTEVIKCPGDKHFRVNIICPLCGHRHHYPINYWPHNYLDHNYYFFGGWFYPADYWERNWPYFMRQPSMPHTSPQPPRPPRDIHEPRPIQPPAPGHPRQQDGDQRRIRDQTPPPPQMGQPNPPRGNQQNHKRKDE